MQFTNTDNTRIKTSTKLSRVYHFSPPNTDAIDIQSVSIPATVENRTQRSQNRESQERADIQRIENWGNYVPEEVQIGIAQIPNCRQRLPIPRDVGEPAQQHSHHQNPTVQIQPLRHPRRHNREGRVQRSRRDIPRRREECGPRCAEKGLLQLHRQVKESVGEESRGGQAEGEQGGEGPG